MRKLVSVITGTYDRPELLKQTIENVRQQDYPNIEHCIVHDGPSDEVTLLVNQNRYSHDGYTYDYDVPIHYIETGRQWSQFLAASISAIPYQMAQWMASGDYLIWLADDERMEPNHISSLVDLLERERSDFAYSRCKIWINPEIPHNPFPWKTMIIGSDPPRNGQITNALYRVELLDYRGFEPHVGSGTDWDQIDHWMKAGAKWSFSPSVTISHRVDKLGEGSNFRIDKQPLIGHSREPELIVLP